MRGVRLAGDWHKDGVACKLAFTHSVIIENTEMKERDYVN